MRRIGVLMGLREDDLETKSRLAKLRQELERLGWSEGSNLHMDIRFAPSGDQGSALAKELVALRPEMILAHTAQVTGALQRETRVIPIVFVNVSDPIGAGFVSNLARPSGNLTGLLQYEEGIIGKWLSFLKEIAPSLVRVALVADPRSPVYDYFVRNAKAAAASLALELVKTEARYIQKLAVNVDRDHAACDSRHGQQRAAPRGIGKWVVTFSSGSVSVRRKRAPDETG
jgi:putative tryptophan/tyrosine transport system substrate-binding protein